MSNYSHPRRFETSKVSNDSHAELWFPEEINPETRQLIEQMAETWIQLEGKLVELCLEHSVSLYLREERNAGLSLIEDKGRADELYKRVGQWTTSNETCNV